MDDEEKILEEVLKEARKHGFQARILRSQELCTLRVEIGKRRHEVAMLITAEELIRVHGMNDLEEKKKWAVGTVRTLMRELQKYIEM